GDYAHLTRLLSELLAPATSDGNCVVVRSREPLGQEKVNQCVENLVNLGLTWQSSRASGRAAAAEHYSFLNVTRAQRNGAPELLRRTTMINDVIRVVKEHWANADVRAAVGDESHWLRDE